MWTPPQWRPGFAFIFVATLGMCGAAALAHAANNAVGLGVACGAMLGLYLALALTVRRELWPLTAAVVAMALPYGLLLGLLAPAALAWALAAAAAVIALWFSGYGMVGRAANRPVERPLEALGGSGAAGRALIVHHPGRSGFQTRVQRAFAAGLAGRGWRVDLATAGPGAPRDLAGVDLLVLGAPVYNFRAASPLLAFLNDLKPPPLLPIVLILSGGGMTDAAMRHLRNRVARAGGRIAAAYEIWTARPNNGLYGQDDPIEIMRRAGEGFPAPPRTQGP